MNEVNTYKKGIWACAQNASTAYSAPIGGQWGTKAVLAFFSVVASSQIFPLLQVLADCGYKGNKKILYMKNFVVEFCDLEEVEDMYLELIEGVAYDDH